MAGHYDEYIKLQFLSLIDIKSQLSFVYRCQEMFALSTSCILRQSLFMIIKITHCDFHKLRCVDVIFHNGIWIKYILFYFVLKL